MNRSILNTMNIVRQISSAVPTLYLTFDDGPDGACTPAVLDLLAAHECHGTFFVVGRHAVRRPGLVRAIHAAGHTIGSHSWDHRVRALVGNDAAVRNWVAKGEDAVADIIGRKAVGFRPPWGARPPNVRRAVSALGLTTYLWNLRFFDAVVPLHPIWARRALAQPAQDGSVVLLHDARGPWAGRGRFLKTLDHILKTGKERGIAFEAIPWLV